MTAQAVAEQGGGAALGRWTRTAQANATFNPERADSAEPRFSYQVTEAGKGTIVSVSVRVTSKAGVGQASWEQETEDAPLYRGTITGTSEHNDPGECGGGWQWSYSGRLAELLGTDQPFAILRPDSEGGSAEGYDETGSGISTVAPCRGRVGCSTGLRLTYHSGNSYVRITAVGDMVFAHIQVHLTTTGEGCGAWPSILEGSFPRSMIGANTINVDLAFGEVSSGTMTLTRVN